VPKKPIKIVIVEEGDERFFVRAFADGSKERVPIVKLPRKKRRPRLDWSRKLSTGLKRGF
jgi:hypothetical protein